MADAVALRIVVFKASGIWLLFCAGLVLIGALGFLVLMFVRLLALSGAMVRGTWFGLVRVATPILESPALGR